MLQQDLYRKDIISLNRISTSVCTTLPRIVNIISKVMQIFPSMKRSAVYTCYILISSFLYMLGAKYGCPAGIDGRCNHVAATLFALEDPNENSEAGEVSCTSKSCRWSVPPKRQMPVKPIFATKFRKHDYQKVKKSLGNRCLVQERM